MRWSRWIERRIDRKWTTAHYLHQKSKCNVKKTLHLLWCRKNSIEPTILNDIDSHCCDTLRTNHPDVRVVCGTMNDLSFGNVDVLVGGMPCQSFSHAGKRLGLNDPRGELLLVFAILLKRTQPKMFLIENVRGLATHQNGDTLKVVMKTLADVGYTVRHELINAVQHGVPQKRERIFIVGIHKSINAETFRFPEPMTKDPKCYPTVRTALHNPPPSPCGKYSEAKRAYMTQIPPGGCWVNLPDEQQKQAYMKASYYATGGRRGILYRLSYDKPCPTLLCNPQSKQSERCHPSELRPLSVREYARIQTFPDTYTFCGNVASQYRQIGNAVPVTLAKRIGQSIQNFLSSACPSLIRSSLPSPSCSWNSP